MVEIKRILFPIDFTENSMVCQIADSFVGQTHIHRKGYVAAIDNLPLTMNTRYMKSALADFIWMRPKACIGKEI
jgi:hypothetical protein